jgi:hypothetical protein
MAGHVINSWRATGLGSSGNAGEPSAPSAQ